MAPTASTWDSTTITVFGSIFTKALSIETSIAKRLQLPIHHKLVVLGMTQARSKVFHMIGCELRADQEFRRKCHRTMMLLIA
ncbi:unnamed protein product [Sympodiomycopsis kandeliae]